MITQKASAGTLESGDIFIEITPTEKEGIDLTLQSTVLTQFGEQIRQTISETLGQLNITDVAVHAVDKGALDCTIRARVTAAVCRSTGKDIWE